VRRIRRHRHHAGPGLIAFLVLFAVAWPILQHPLAVVLCTAGCFAASALIVRRRHHHRRHKLTRARAIVGFQQMDPTQFEYALADLCRRDGCRNVERVGGGGDLAADVLATAPDGRRILIQAKRYARGNPVRSPALQAVNGTYRDIHGAQLAAVVTTSSFTQDAASFGKRVGLRLLDEHALAAWASRTGPAPWQ
jgi:restriction system protein